MPLPRYESMDRKCFQNLYGHNSGFWKVQANQIYNRFEDSRVRSVVDQLSSFDEMLGIFRELVDSAEQEAPKGNELYDDFKGNQIKYKQLIGDLNVKVAEMNRVY